MKRMNCVLVVVALTIGVGAVTRVASIVAQEAAPANAARGVGEDEAGRLPPGYTVVVTKAQRARIYAIQDSYQKQLEDLKKQISQIEAKRDQEIASLLDEEQKKIVAYVLKLRDLERKQEPSAENADQNK